VNGDPLLVERAVGRGRVMQWATSCDDRWSNLPLREVFVPLMQQLVLYGATATLPQLNLETGQPIAISWRAPAEAAAQSAVDLLTPQGERYRLEPQHTSPPTSQQSAANAPAASKPSENPPAAEQPAAEQRSILFVRTQFPGAYQLSGIGGQTLTVAVNARAEESDLTQLSPDALQTIAERLEAELHDSAADFWRAEMIKQTGREIWRWLLIVLVVCLFAELLLQQSLTRTPL
jgi:hypothetical protein